MNPPLDFPDRHYDEIGDYLDDYSELASIAWRGIDRAALRHAGKALLNAYTSDRQVFVCGNGGSAAIAEHFECDHMKGVHAGTALRPRVRSLGANPAVLTAVANDLAYDEIFAFPLGLLAQPNDVLLAISSSGNSPNIVKALEYANAHGLLTIALTGFDGGRARRIAHVAIHVDAANYGVVEDVHQGIVHVLAQFIRQMRTSADLIASARF